MRFLICGLGSIGRRHLRNLTSLNQKDIVLLRSGRGTLPDQELEGFPVEMDLNKALHTWDPDALIVSNPTALHLDAAIPGAEAGCHLFLEKPLSHSMERLDQLAAALKQGGGSVLVGFQFRFHPGLLAIRDLIEQGTLGRVLSVRAHWGEYLPGWHPWEDYRNSYSARSDLGGGVVRTLCHPFDYLRMLHGEVDWVTAEIGTNGLPGMDVEDRAEVLLGFRNGVLGSVHLDYNQRPTRHYLEIVAENGVIRWDNAHGCAAWWSEESSEWQSFKPAEDFERNTLFRDEMKHFIQVVEGKTSPLCTMEDGFRTQEIIEAVYASSDSGRRVRLGKG